MGMKDFRQKASETLFVKLSFMSSIKPLRHLESELDQETSRKMRNQRKIDIKSPFTMSITINNLMQQEACLEG